MKRFFKNNLNKILVIIIYILMFYVVGELLIKIFEDKIIDENSMIGFTVFNNAVIYITIIISCVVLLRKEIITDFKVLEKKDAVKVFLTCLGGVGLVYAGNFVGSIITQILGGTADSANQKALEMIMFSKYGFIMIVFIVIIGPITEELIFRKALHDVFRHFKMPSGVILLISSVLFGLIHVINAGDFVQVFPYIFMGLTLGRLEIKNENIYPSIFVHIFINGVSTAMIFYMDKFQDILPM